MGTLLHFPERDRGRKRRRNSPAAMGDMSLYVTRNLPIPANVARIATAKDREELDHAELSLLLATAIFAKLPAEQKASLRDELILLDLGKGDRRAIAVLDIIGRP